MNYYIEIPQTFAESMNGTESTIVPDIFAYTQTLDGRYVTALQAFINYPQQFMELKDTGWVFDPIELTTKDFPIQESLNDKNL